MVVNNVGQQAAPEANLNPTTSSPTTLNTAAKSTQAGTKSPTVQEPAEKPVQEIHEVGLAGETASAGNQSNQQPGKNLNAFA
ncbi:MAG TPA: hypothetical protein VKM93_00940 [Terriglobia bacterium]|nr:hypothetical protein [Terriglobia bacterium]